LEDTSPTTVSLCTPPGRGGIAVLVLDGPGTAEILSAAFRPLRTSGPDEAGRLRLGRLVDASGEPVDEAIVQQRDGRAEVGIHGGPAAVRAALHRFAGLGAQVADAPPADCLPLAHPQWHNPAVGAELLAALPHVRTSFAASCLTQQWSGGLSRLARETLAFLTDPKSQISDSARLPPRLIIAAEAFSATRRLIEPAELVLAGPPNAGKSALMNVLVGRRVSLVHDHPGTTRDWVRELASFGGVPVWLTDTAGPWDVPEGVDAEAVRRARRRAEAADLVLRLAPDGAQEPPEWLHAKRTLLVRSKCDVSPATSGGLRVSAATGEGLDQLRRAALAALGLDGLDPAQPAAFTQRQADLLRKAAEATRTDATAAARALGMLLEG